MRIPLWELRGTNDFMSKSFNVLPSVKRSYKFIYFDYKIIMVKPFVVPRGRHIFSNKIRFRVFLHSQKWSFEKMVKKGKITSHSFYLLLFQQFFPFHTAWYKSSFRPRMILGCAFTSRAVSVWLSELTAFTEKEIKLQ